MRFFNPREIIPSSQNENYLKHFRRPNQKTFIITLPNLMFNVFRTSELCPLYRDSTVILTNGESWGMGSKKLNATLHYPSIIP